MKNRTTISSAIITLILCGLCACTEESDKITTDDLLAGTGITSEDFGDLATGSPDLNSAALEGTWTMSNAMETNTVRFDSNGTGEHLPGPDDTSEPQEFDWALEGHVLTSALTWLDDDGGESNTTCSEYEAYSTSIAVVDDRLYQDALVRIAGNGGTLDGRWEMFVAESESWDCEGESGTESETESLSLEISGTTFVWTETEILNSTDDSFDFNDEDQIEGTVKVEDGIIYLMADGDPDATFAAFVQVSEDAMIYFSWDEGVTAEEFLAESGFVKQ